MCLCAEARGLVRALLQPDPTVRLTAEQTLLHPWVKAMASICRQRALTDQTQRDTADTGAEPDKSRQVQRLAQTNAAETTTDTIPGHTNLEGEVTHKEFNRHDERQTEMNTERGQDENKPLRQQSRETSIVHTISPQLQVHTPSVATPGQQKPECISACSSSPNREPSMPEMQDPGPPDCDLGSPVSPSVELNPLGAPSAQSEFPSQIKTENSQQQLPTYSPTSTNTVQRTTAGNLTEHHPSLNPAAPSSSSHSLHQQNCTSPLRNSTTATAQNHPSENYDKPNAYTTATHPPTQS